MSIRLPALAMLMLAAAPAFAQKTATQSETERHKACIAKIETDAKGAYEDALSWLSLSGDRPAARHCAALALIEIGRPEEGAIRLEDLANATDAGGIEARSIYLAQAGNAWLIARKGDAAILTLTNALKLRPQDNELYKDRARAYMMKKEWDKAGHDLNAANDISPRDAEAWRMRATTLKEMGRLDEAWQDLQTAMMIAPRDVQNVVLRGDIREALRLAGKPDPEDKPNIAIPNDTIRPVVVGN